jgi:hypothetical protein
LQLPAVELHGQISGVVQVRTQFQNVSNR